MTKKEPSFEDYLSKLKESLEKLDENNLPLDEALETYEQGMEAYRNCSNALKSAQRKVRILAESSEEETFEDFEEGNMQDDTKQKNRRI